MRWLLIGGLVAIAFGTSGLAGAAAVLTLGGHLALDKQMGGATLHGEMIGPMMAGAAVRYVPEEQARTFGDQAPEGARVDRTGKVITFQTTTVHLKVLGSLEGDPEMTFRIGGLSNPTIAIPRGATVEVEFINGDRDTSHGWQLVRRQGSFSHMPMMDNQGSRRARWCKSGRADPLTS
ncbi:MAG: hypothetical protein M3072_14320 [Candidatus Dormibacteraeota bacterium]|nr:hypothetical protein [Candidatus Dormibacteraeota bacterium]